MALLHFPSVGKCSVEIAKANSFIIIFNTWTKEGEPDPKWTKTGDHQLAEEEKSGTSRGASLNPIEKLPPIRQRKAPPKRGPGVRKPWETYRPVC